MPAPRLRPHATPAARLLIRRHAVRAALTLAAAAPAPALAHNPLPAPPPPAAPAPAPTALESATPSPAATAAAAAIAASPNDWTLSVVPRAWYVSPSGRFRLPSSTTQGNEARINDLNLDAPRLRPYGEFHLKSGPVRVVVSAANYGVTAFSTAPSSIRVGDTSINAGDFVRSKIDLSTAQLSGGYRLYRLDFGAEDAAPNRTVLDLEAVAGVRLYDTELSVTNGASSSRFSTLFGELFAGGRAELTLARDFSVDVEFTAGGFPGDKSVFAFDIAVAFSWRPVDWAGIQIGYRNLAYTLEDGSGARQFRYRGALAGLFGGVVFRF